MSQLRVGFIGLGTVGGGALTCLRDGRDTIARRVGAEIVPVRAAVREVHRIRDLDLSGVAITDDAVAVAQADDVDILVEVMGGVDVARRAVEAALQAGKPVVTANKELIAKHGPALFELAEQHGVEIAFEGSVAGGIPILQPLRGSLAGNHIRKIIGIINGTTNYILSAMARTGRAFDDLLAEAQAEGYAEADPSADVDGHDAAYKLAILAMLAFDTAIDEAGVYREGIRHVDPEDIRLAAMLGYTIKLLGLAHDRGERLELRVHPTLVPITHPLASVHGVFNAIFVEGSASGPLMFYGRGAGAGPTGSAVVGDLVEVARNLRSGGARKVPRLGNGRRAVGDISQARSSYYVRLHVLDQPGVFAAVAHSFAEQGVSLAQVLQTQATGGTAEIIIVTHESEEANVRAAMTAIRALPMVERERSLLRCLSVDE